MFIVRNCKSWLYQTSAGPRTNSGVMGASGLVTFRPDMANRELLEWELDCGEITQLSTCFGDDTRHSKVIPVDAVVTTLVSIWRRW